MKPNLKEISVCAVDSVNPGLASRAINQCLNSSSFADAILFSDTNVNINTPKIRQIKIEKITSKNAYSKFLLKDISKYINTSYVLIVQWDGYVIDPESWRANFLNYDYIGAEWHWHKDGMNVGNGGFSLRSKRLLDALSIDEFPFIENINEDEQICRIYRKKLEIDFGIKFAPAEVANEFAYERSLPQQSTFGFHGLFNMWRHISDNEMIELANQLHPSSLSSREYYELIAKYYSLQKFLITKILYAKLKQHHKIENIIESFLSVIGNTELTRDLIINCETLLSQKT